MRVGDTIAGRYLIEREAGVGGMGRVFRALDRDTGETVALKVLTHPDAASRDRFVREAAILRTLEHPAIVRYLAEGATASGQPFLAMQWLEGATLSAVLRTGALRPEEAAKLGARVAAALAVAHAAGVVHRDVKPSNLVLPGGTAEAVVLVDFGVARRAREALGLTRTGMIVGSCAYMSPEQALGSKEVDARTDLFSLGCVLYEAVAGRRTFAARDATAVLAKILLDDPPRLREVAPGVPAALDDVVMRLLAKDRKQRPRSARELAEELGALATRDPSVATAPPPAPSLTRMERRVCWVILAANAGEAAADEEVPSALRGAVEEVVGAHGGSLAFLADGSAIASFQGAGIPTDQAPRAARCALALREVLPDSPMAIAMGLGVVGEATPVGAVIDAVAQAVNEARAPAIRLHGISEGLLAGFALSRGERGWMLVGRTEAAAGRTLLGKPTDCVGRDRELAMLEGLYEKSESDPQAVVAIVTAHAGVGKSRVRRELLTRLASRDEPPTVLFGRCDVMRQGAAFGPLLDAVRRRAGVTPADTPEAQRAKVEAVAAGVKDAARARHVAAMLGELAGVPFPDDTSEKLRAARQDARLMGELMRDAFEDWLAAECDAAPVVLVLEDMHWGDLPTVRFVDAALRNLAERPLFVLALARPDVDDIFPRLWSERGATTVPLAPLSRTAAEKLVRAAAGASVDPETAARIVERAQGNPFFLEELLRAAEAGLAELPESVLGTLQARLGTLNEEARRVLRGASVFGERFTREGVAVLLGGDDAAETVRRELLKLHELEMVVTSGDDDHAFRHALVREAAYAMLTGDDRRLGHRLAGEFLEARGTTDAASLAEHFFRGDEPSRAAPHFLRAAAQAMEGNDLARAVELAERCVSLSPEPPTAAAAHGLAAEAQRWRGHYADAAAHSLQAIAGHPRGGVAWFVAVGEYIAACAYMHDFDAAGPYVELAMRTAPRPDAINAQAICVSRGCTQLLEAGRFAEADAAIASMLQHHFDSPDDEVRGWVSWLVAMRALGRGDLGEFVVRTEKCLAAFERLGKVRNMFSHRTNLGYAYAELGDFERAEQTLRSVLAESHRSGIPMLEAYALHNLGNVLKNQGRLEEGMAATRRAVDVARVIEDPRIEGASRAYLAQMQMISGDLASAEVEAHAGVRLLGGNPPLLGVARAVLASVLLAQGRAAEAAEEADGANRLLDGGAEDGETLIRLVHAETLRAAGQEDAARSAITAAKERLLARAAKIGDESFRASFLRVPESARTLALAREWGAPPGEAG